VRADGGWAKEGSTERDESSRPNRTEMNIFPDFLESTASLYPRKYQPVVLETTLARYLTRTYSLRILPRVYPPVDILGLPADFEMHFAASADAVHYSPESPTPATAHCSHLSSEPDRLPSALTTPLFSRRAFDSDGGEWRPRGLLSLSIYKELAFGCRVPSPPSKC